MATTKAKKTETKQKNTESLETKTKTNRKKGKRKKNIKSIIPILKSHKLVSIILLAVILIIIFLLLITKTDYTKRAVVIGIDNYSMADMNMSLYNLKYNYFGKDASDIPDATLEEELTSVGMSVSDYLKAQAVSELKYRSVIKKMAQDNNISLSDEDRLEVSKKIDEIINNFGSHRKFKKFLKANGINEKSYKEYLEANKLYDKVFNTLYKSGGSKYFTQKELEQAKQDYTKTYYKVNQIVLAIVNTSTKEPLSETAINQKETLAKSLLTKAKGDTDFVELVKKYSEEKSEDNVFYFKSGEVLDEVYEAVTSLDTGEVSNIIKTKYAYSIIKRLELDDKKLDEYLNSLLKNKFNEDITSASEDYKVIYENVYKEIK